MNIQQFSSRFIKVASDNSPTILTVVGATGLVATAVLTGRASFKAAEILAEVENEGLERVDKLKAVAPQYIPAVVTGVVSVAAIIGANRIGGRRAAALAAAYALSEKAIEQYKDEVVEMFGDGKAQEVADKVAQKKVEQNPPTKQDLVVIGDGEVLCMEGHTGRYFKSTLENIKRAENYVNREILSDGYASLDTFYRYLDIPSTTLSNEVGWQSPSMLELDISTAISEDGRPCFVLNYNLEPVRNYYKFGAR